MSNPITDRILRRLEGYRFYNIFSKIPLLTDKNTTFVDLTIQWLCSAQFKRGCIKGFFPRGSTIIRKDEVYPEITGYAATTFSKLYLLTGKKNYLEKAIMASDALLRFMQPNGAIPSIIHKDGAFDDLVYSFDQGMMAKGLLDTYQACLMAKNPGGIRYKDGSVKAIAFLQKIQKKDGSLPDTCNLNGDNHSAFTYCIMGKIAMTFIKAYQITKDAEYLRAAELLANNVIDTFQTIQGEFRLPKPHPRNRVHYHCYAIEGIISLYNLTGEEKYYMSARKGADSLLKIQKGNGGFSNRLPSDEESDPYEDVPPSAQAICIWLFFYRKVKDKKYLEASNRALEYLKARQYRIRGGKLLGGLPFILPSNNTFACTWAVEFAIEAFFQYQEVIKNYSNIS